MKKIMTLLIASSIALFSGCSNDSEKNNNLTESNEGLETASDSSNSSENQVETSNKENLYNSEDVEEGYWIGQSGQEIENSDMITTNSIEYDPNVEYEMNKTAYVSYYNNEDLINTVLYSDATPITIEANNQANNIRISFDKSKKESFEFYSK